MKAVPKTVLLLWIATIAIMAGVFLVIDRGVLRPPPATARAPAVSPEVAAAAQASAANRVAVLESRGRVAPGVAAAPATRNGPEARPDDRPSQQGKVAVDEAAKFVHFRVGNRNVRRILRDGDVIWVATTGGIVRFNTATNEYLFFDERAGLRASSALFVGKVGATIVAGTNGGGLAVYDERNRKWNALGERFGGREAVVHDAVKVRNGDVWLATGAGVVRVRGGRLEDAKSWERHTVASTGGRLPSDWVYGVAEGRPGEIWLATAAGVARHAAGAWRSWSHAQGLGAPARAAAPATASASPTTADHRTAPDVNPNFVLSIVADASGVWAGTWGGGLARFDGREWRNFAEAQGLPGAYVYALQRDGEGLWIGTDKGLARWDGERFRVLKKEQGLLSDNVFAVASGARQDVWVGSFGGVAHLLQP